MTTGPTYSVVRLNERVVHSDNVDVLVLHAMPPSALALAGGDRLYIRIAEDDATNAAETVDTDLLLVNHCSCIVSSGTRAP